MNSSDDLVNHWIADLRSSGWQRFVYVSEAVFEPSSEVEVPLDGSENSPKARVFPLSTTQVGDRVQIVSLNCGEANNHLMGMGFMPGVVLEVISCLATGSVVVALQDQRLGLGADMAKRIQVIDAKQPLGENSEPLPKARMATMSSPSNLPPIKLRDVAIGSKLRVVGYEKTAQDYKRKLLSMGLTPGTELRVTRHAPLGDPTEIEVRDFHLSLRKDEANALVVEPILGE